ncbi:agmatine deiminase family protein, partial [bacterium]|nr:agmatine deiminase family protein [bacterium]
LLNNGRGLGLLSARVLERNAAEPGFAPRETLQNVASLLGLENVVALHPPADEPTGHLSVVACFLAPDLIVVGRDGARADAATADHLDGLARELAGAPTLVGPLRVARIPQPDHRDGVWRSYTEIVFANGVVLVPVYPDHCPDLDAEALAVYRRLLPDRRIEPIDASALARRGGGLHRVTVNVPASRGLGDGP